MDQETYFIIEFYAVTFNSSLSPFSLCSFSAFPLFLNKMSAIVIAERPIVTNPAGINDETKESITS